jgi:hypothetical protein
MASKNKGGREVRKPKQETKSKGQAVGSGVVSDKLHGTKDRPAK